MELKLNDVYSFWYNEEWRKKIFDPDWCFDGQLIVRQIKSSGELYLEDTYWSPPSSENKVFTLEQALERGELTFVCNLNDIEKCRKSDFDYYADEDLFDLSTQHMCYKESYKKKGAIKSSDKMKQVLEYKIETIKHEIEWQNSELQRIKEKLQKLNDGDINIYI